MGTVGATAKRWLLVALVCALAVAGCGHAALTSPPTTTMAPTTTSTTVADSNLTVVGVRPGVLQAPFYPQTTVTRVSCGVAPMGGRFVRLDLAPGAAGTPPGSVLTVPTAVIVVPGGAVLLDPRFLSKVLYAESMKSITTATQGAFVLTLQNAAGGGGDGLTVVAGNVQVYGDYQCPDTDVAYPGT